MVLAIDIGNSNVVIGLSDDKSWPYLLRLPTQNEKDALFYYETRLTNYLFEEQIKPEQLTKAVISSVVPDLRSMFEELVVHLFKIRPVIVAPPIYDKFHLKIDNPTEIGTDLLANAVAAHYRFKQGVIIVDFGTALTFTVVNAQGHILGVNIAPGLKTAISALFNKTAQLPEVPLELPRSVIGKNTVHAIQSGVLVGYIGLVKHMLHQIRMELGEQFIAVATGGLSSILEPLHDEFQEVDLNLTLNGLKKIVELVEESPP